MTEPSRLATKRRPTDAEPLERLAAGHFAAAGMAIFAAVFFSLQFAVIHAAASDPQRFFLNFAVAYASFGMLNLAAGICIWLRK